VAADLVDRRARRGECLAAVRVDRPVLAIDRRPIAWRDVEVVDLVEELRVDRPDESSRSFQRLTSPIFVSVLCARILAMASRRAAV
jgi:hypothetical protein